MRTQAEIDAECVKLRELQKTVRPVTAFGDDNVAAVTAMLDVLEAKLDRAGVEATYGENEDNKDEDGNDPFFDQHVYDAACTAQEWRDEEIDDAPSEGWPT